MSCWFDTRVLPVDGSTPSCWIRKVRPPVLTARLYEVPASDVAGQVSIGGPASTLAVPSLGQNGVWSFAGAAGQRVYFSFSAGTFGSSSWAEVKVRKPDGTTLAIDSSCGVSCWFDTRVLPVDGTYTILLDPQGAATGSLTARLYEVPASDVAGQVSIGGPASTLAVPWLGQNGVWSFAGAAGQRVYFYFSAGTFGSSSWAEVKVRKPDGTTLAIDSSCGVSCWFDTLGAARRRHATPSCWIGKVRPPGHSRPGRPGAGQ